MSAVLSSDKQRRESDEAVEVLRSVWTARGQSEDDLGDIVGNERACKRMADVGFSELASEGDDLRSAWRETLERDGKLSRGSGSVADLVFGSADAQSG
jgi:hypothetical protein